MVGVSEGHCMMDFMPNDSEPALAARAQELLTELAGPGAQLRPQQLEAIDLVVAQRRRALVVQRTGFGKSAIYFIATALLRGAGAGPTLVVSPLLALMRDQVAAAERMGVRAATVNSTNADAWAEIERRLAANEVDLLCISPERLNSPAFVESILPKLAASLGMLVIDEAHCISDWGHDFRPDYRRIRDAIANLPAGTPVLATTATANARVCIDVAEQLGDDVTVLRGGLDRESLVLGVARVPSLAHRLAWLAQHLPTLSGTGIVYCLTVAQTTQVAEFLRSRGIDAVDYSSAVPSELREQREAAFRANEVEVLVATSALGMGVDKPDVAFVCHLGAPPSPVAYYQQVGRAGRSLDRAEAWLLPGEEDRAIWDWFASVGMPPEPLVQRVLDALASSSPNDPVSLMELERAVDLRRGRLEAMLKILDVDGAVRRRGKGWVRTDVPWSYDRDRVARIEAARRHEADAMVGYAAGTSCLMEQLRADLDDPGAEPCGRCQVCTGAADPVVLDSAVVRAAVEFLRGVDIEIEPRKQWARGLDEPRGNLKPDRRAEVGRSLSRVDDAGWWPLVEQAFTSGAVEGELIEGLIELLERWPAASSAKAITWIPSTRRDPLLAGIVEQLAARRGLTVLVPLARTFSAPPQSATQNAAHRVRNVWGAFSVDAEVLRPAGGAPLFVLDDVYDSGWTMTVVADRLRAAGVSAVLPLVLARR